MYFFGNVLPCHDDFLPKTKMVRVVHMNIFYRMDLEICDIKNEFWTKTENLGFRKQHKKYNLRSNIEFLDKN